ncbi:hypothetical protein [Haloferula sp.]|uniref:hypothetical protein n=1 Tax=Haloferula sp. TaxID=2497595 RepID=UPI003C75B0D8
MAFTIMLFVGPQRLAQVPVGQDSAPWAGALIEPGDENEIPKSKFNNLTADDLAILYGNEKFMLKPGANKTVPVPIQPNSELRIFEKQPAASPLERVTSKSSPNDPMRLIPFR